MDDDWGEKGYVANTSIFAHALHIRGTRQGFDEITFWNGADEISPHSRKNKKIEHVTEAEETLC